MKNFYLAIVGFVAAVGVAACSDDSDTSGTGSGTERTGITECGIQECSAGMHCDNGICADGCTSDNNCAGNQTCIKTGGENIGSCQNNTKAPTKDCPAFVDQCTKCGEPAGTCQQACDGLSNECVQCVIDTGGCEAVTNCPSCG